MDGWLKKRLATKLIMAYEGRTPDALVRYAEKRTGDYRIASAATMKEGVADGVFQG